MSKTSNTLRLGVGALLEGSSGPGKKAKSRQAPQAITSLLANLPGMVYRCRNDDRWTMDYASEGCRALTGYAPDDLLAGGTVHFEAIIFSPDRERVRAEIHAALQSGPRFEVSYRIVTATGVQRWVLDCGLAAGPAENPAAFFEGIIFDITARKNAEEALLNSEPALGAIIDHSVQSMGLLDPSGRVLRANHTVLAQTGDKWEDLAGRLVWDSELWSHTRAGKDQLREAVSRAAKGEVVRYETTCRRVDGCLLTIDFSLTPVRGPDGVVISLVAEGRDITEQKNAERAVLESEEKFAKSFRSSPYSLTISDLETGRYLEVNSGFERISGYRREEVIGRTSSELGIWHSPADRDELIRRLRKEGMVRGMEIKFVNRTGDVLVTGCSCEVLELGGRACLLSAIEDITVQRKAEEARALMEQQLRHAQKLESLGQLAGGIAHDFNNILTGVLAYTELALMDCDRPAEVRKHLDQVSRAGRRARELVRQILAFSRQQIQQRKPLSLAPIIQEAVALLRSSLPSTIKIEAQIESQVPVVLADATQIHQIILNLATNSAHAMAARPGTLSVRVETVRLDEAACGIHQGLRPGEHALLTVSDTGCGMSPEIVKCVFEPFFTTKGPGEGTGLGLAVVHGIVEDHDGVIQLESRVGEGTTLRIFLPAHEALVPADLAEPRAVRGSSHERILFLDDEQMIADSVRLLLEHLGYHVTAYTDARAALAVFTADPAAYDIVVTDLTMPSITGIEVARQMLKIRPGIPILLVSGFSFTWTEEKIRAMGLRGLIAKPLTSAVLAKSIRQALDERST